MDSSPGVIAASAAEFADDSFAFESGPDMPFIDPRRPELKLRPGVAWHHFTELLKDKERTEEVFHIFEALPWKGMRAAARAFVTSARGRAIRASEPSLPPILDDHAALRRLPAGTVGQVYCDFMEREGLTAGGLVDEFAKFQGDRPRFDDLLEWYAHRLRDTHDLLHILTGYGRDALGEQCVLAFTYSQQPSPAHLFIGYAGGLNIKKEVRSKAPVLRAIREGQRLGKACPRVAEMPIRELLAMPLDEARRRFGIAAPRQYERAHAIYRAEGIDPYDLLGKAA
ncbi:MAG: Coq4 family protein [Novosphingobium sp.]